VCPTSRSCIALIWLYTHVYIYAHMASFVRHLTPFHYIRRRHAGTRHLMNVQH